MQQSETVWPERERSRFTPVDPSLWPPERLAAREARELRDSWRGLPGWGVPERKKKLPGWGLFLLYWFVLLVMAYG